MSMVNVTRCLPLKGSRTVKKPKKVILTALIAAALVIAPATTASADSNGGPFSCQSGWSWGTRLVVSGVWSIKHTRSDGTWNKATGDHGVWYSPVYKNWGYQSGSYVNTWEVASSIRENTNHCDR